MKIHANKVLKLTQAKVLFLAIIAIKDFIQYPIAKRKRIRANKVL